MPLWFQMDRQCVLREGHASDAQQKHIRIQPWLKGIYALRSQLQCFRLNYATCNRTGLWTGLFDYSFFFFFFGFRLQRLPSRALRWGRAKNIHRGWRTRRLWREREQTLPGRLGVLKVKTRRPGQRVCSVTGMTWWLMVTLTQGRGAPWHLESYLAWVVMVIPCSAPWCGNRGLSIP